MTDLRRAGPRCGRPLSWGRAVLAGAVACFGAVTAHVAAGGDAPGPWALAVLPMAVVVFGLVVRRSHDLPALAGASLLVQLVWHQLLSLSHTDVGTHGHGHAVAEHGAVDMLPAHLVVAALTVLPCLAVERVLDDLAEVARTLGRALRVVLPPRILVEEPASSSETGHAATYDVPLLRVQHVVVRHPDRGPPLRPSDLALTA